MPMRILITRSLLIGLLFTSAASAQTNTVVATGEEGQTLEDFFTAALDFSPRLRIAEDRLDVGQAQRRSVTGQLLPQVSANASVSENRQWVANDMSDYTGQRYSLQLQQVLFDWQTFARRGRAYAMENQYEAEYYNELATLFADVAERYFNVLETRDALATIETELNAIRNQSEQVERLHQFRQVPVTELYDIQARLSTLEARKASLEGQVIMAKEALRSATGLQVGDLYELGDQAQLTAPEEDAETWAQRARDASHLVSAREFAVEAAERSVSEQRGNYMPQLSLTLQGQRSDLGFDNQPINRRDTAYVGLNLTVPLFAGGSNRARVSEAQSQRSMASNELRQVQLEVADQARMLVLQMQANERLIGAAEQVLESMTVAAESRQRGFDIGNVTSVELLEALRDRFSAERELQALRYDQINFSLRLRQVAGLLEADDLIEVSSWMRPPARSE